MATQDERIATLEQTFTVFRQELARRTQETDENLTILLGVIRHQGQDIRRIFERVDTIDARLSTIDTRLDRVENMLAQVLARLPEKP